MIKVNNSTSVFQHRHTFRNVFVMYSFVRICRLIVYFKKIERVMGVMIGIRLSNK